MTKKDGLSWQAWLQELLRVAQCCGYSSKDETDWRQFRLSYDDNMTPAEAMIYEMSYA